MRDSPAQDRLSPPLAAAVDRLRSVAPVERVILFGSRARGDHDAGSDWDLCVLLDDDIPAGVYSPGSLWWAVRDLGLPIQLVPMRRSVFESRRSDINALAHDVAEEGIVLFDRATIPAP
ncbi:MAG: nucleotidyltransferase domain-containing protein [Actinomycetospora chiangmaiensis]|nr:nucleotidyltransferase domain-containing protein [Actinomycetospora chiangmaiensis]